MEHQFSNPEKVQNLRKTTHLRYQKAGYGPVSKLFTFDSNAIKCFYGSASQQWLKTYCYIYQSVRSSVHSSVTKLVNMSDILKINEATLMQIG